MSVCVDVLVCAVLCSSTKKKGSGKLHGKSLELRKQSAKANELKEIIELNKRISQETPPSGVSTQHLTHKDKK